MAVQDTRLEDCRRILSHFSMEAWTKAGLAQNLEGLAMAPEFLTKLRPVMKEAQLRALLETITRAGMHRVTEDGDDHLLIWNSGGYDLVEYDLNVIQLHRPYHFEGHQYDEAGAVPEYKLFNPPVQMHKNPWELRFRYGNVLELASGNREEMDG